jgi:hypothetical protein
MVYDALKKKELKTRLRKNAWTKALKIPDCEHCLYEGLESKTVVFLTMQMVSDLFLTISFKRF